MYNYAFLAGTVTIFVSTSLMLSSTSCSWLNTAYDLNKMKASYCMNGELDK